MKLIELPSVIKPFRKEQHITLEKLSEKTGINISHLSKIENGKWIPNIETLDKIFAALNIKVVPICQDESLLDEAIGDVMVIVRLNKDKDAHKLIKTQFIVVDNEDVLKKSSK